MLSGYVTTVISLGFFWLQLKASIPSLVGLSVCRNVFKKKLSCEARLAPGFCTLEHKHLNMYMESVPVCSAWSQPFSMRAEIRKLNISYLCRSIFADLSRACLEGNFGTRHRKMILTFCSKEPFRVIGRQNDPKGAMGRHMEQYGAI